MPFTLHSLSDCVDLTQFGFLMKDQAWVPPFLAKSVLDRGHPWVDPRVAQQGPIPCAHFQLLLPGLSLSVPNP